ncbi:M20 family metallopeptidase [Ammoniphilus sp. YIM 78166]|uniref:M20 family metallopeptidase n=1 Tax=Ammoniphilus sp. YIM 78166 TaxID=1644106 RepID=UPI00107067F6|nr:M20/M25/M40 family metallo-hydrolase [Ammoniphilus sp. YIM 78166]
MSALLKLVEKGINREDLMDLALRLIRRPSPQTDQMEFEPLVKSFIRETLVDELKQRNIEDVTLDDMGNLICRIGNKNAKKKIFFLGYAMNHPASSMVDPYKGEVVDTVKGKALRGRGIAEQKGSLAGMIAAADFLNKHQDQLDGELIFAVSLAGETGRHLAVDNICKTLDLKADLGIVGIGTNGDICQGNKGRVDVHIHVYGKSCHSSTPASGINAIEGASLVVQKLQGLVPAGEHPRLGRPTLTSTSIKSFPDATHTIQNECRLVFDRRLLPGDEAETALGEIRDALGNMDPYRIEVKEGPVTFPSEVPDDSIVIQELRTAIEEIRETEAKCFFSNGAIDAGYVNKCGIPAVMFGPGQMDMWHTDNELLTVDDLVEGARIYTYLSFKYLSKR